METEDKYLNIKEDNTIYISSDVLLKLSENIFRNMRKHQHYFDILFRKFICLEICANISLEIYGPYCWTKTGKRNCEDET